MAAFSFGGPVLHSESQSIHMGAYIQSSDPGAVGAKVLWIDTTSGYVLKKRDDANTGWDTLSGDLSAAGTGINETILDAKGDLIAASAADTAAKLTVGADGTILVAASGQSTGLQWQSLSTAGIQPLDAELTALAGLTSAADKGIQFTGSGTAATYDLTAAGKALLDDANAAAQLVTLGAAPTASPTFTGTVTLPADQALSGNPTTTTQSSGNSSTRIATTAFVAAAITKPPQILEYALSDETTAITTGLKLTTRAPFAFTLTNVRISLTTTSSSGNPAVDMKESGTTVFSTTPKIDSGELTNVTGTAAVISDSAIADDAELTFIVDTAGTGAKGLKIRLYVTPT